MDFEGPLTFLDANDNISKKLSINKLDIITVVYSSDKDIIEDQLEWLEGECGIIQDTITVKGPVQNRTFQLWPSIPRDFERPRYKEMIKLQVPSIPLPDDAGMLRIIVGEFQNQKGPLQADTLDFLDMRLNAGHTITINHLKNQNVALFVICGELTLDDGKKLGPAELGIFKREGDTFKITSNLFSKVILLSGPAINEPEIKFGEFKLNTYDNFKDGIIK